MKKSLFIIALLLLLPLGVFAAEPQVLTVKAESKDSTVSFEGTTEDGLVAVMCKLIDSSDEEADMLSTEVSENAFKGEFTNVANGKYTVSCARYEGGDFVTAAVTVNNTSNPQTLDTSAITSVVILSVGVAGIVGASIYLNNKKKVNSN